MARRNRKLQPFKKGCKRKNRNTCKKINHKKMLIQFVLWLISMATEVVEDYMMIIVFMFNQMNLKYGKDYNGNPKET